MANIKPFQALRPQTDFVEKLASRPYDVLSRTEAAEEAKDNPYSFLHITRPDIDLPDSTDPHAPQVYEKAKENLGHFIQSGILFTEEKPCYYIYRLEMPSQPGTGDPPHIQTGLVCLSSVQDYDDDIIKKHEFTRPEKVQDRIDHMIAVKAQTGNVLMAYRDTMELDALINGWKATNKPVYDITTGDNIHHTIWRIDREPVITSITQLFKTKVPFTYIADGHHRAASAAKVSKELPGHEASKYFLTTIFPGSQLSILDYNRVVKDLHGLSIEKFLGRLQDDFYLTLSPDPVKPAQPHEFGMYLDKQWYILSSRKGTWSDDAIGVLDVTILANNVLEKILGIKDQRTDKRIDFIGGIRGLAGLEKRVDSGEMKVAFSLFPVSMQQLFTVADEGKTMPPKSTWFEPKLRDGLLSNMI
jgi:uncharacterized protein (DUF1015 family)